MAKPNENEFGVYRHPQRTVSAPIDKKQQAIEAIRDIGNPHLFLALLPVISMMNFDFKKTAPKIDIYGAIDKMCGVSVDDDVFGVRRNLEKKLVHSAADLPQDLYMIAREKDELENVSDYIHRSSEKGKATYLVYDGSGDWQGFFLLRPNKRQTKIIKGIKIE